MCGCRAIADALHIGVQIFGPQAVAVDLDLGAEIPRDESGLAHLRRHLHHPHIAGVIDVADRDRADADRCELVPGAPREALIETGAGFRQQLARRVVLDRIRPRRRRRVRFPAGIDVAADRAVRRDVVRGVIAERLVEPNAAGVGRVSQPVEIVVVDEQIMRTSTVRRAILSI